MTMLLERNAYRKSERSKQRFFAASLVDALRGRDKDARVFNVGEPVDEIKPGKAKSATFIVRGAHKPSKWALGDYAALVLTPQWIDADGTVYQIALREPDFDSIKARLEIKGWACGHEMFHVDLRVKHPVRTYACEFCELLAGNSKVYREDEGEFRRNRHAGITREQAMIADLLLEGSSVTPLSFSNN